MTDAIVLLSGGLDSAVVLAWAHALGRTVHAVVFDYGQRHRIEIESAHKLAELYSAASFVEVCIDLKAVAPQALLIDDTVSITNGSANGLSTTYLPGRNTTFLSCALARAEVTGSTEILIGATAEDQAGYPDCRPAYLTAFARLAGAALGRPCLVLAPLVGMTKAEVITLGAKLGVDFGITVSCYDPGKRGRQCGVCDACMVRARGFRDAGFIDPLSPVTRCTQ